MIGYRQSESLEIEVRCSSVRSGKVRQLPNGKGSAAEESEGACPQDSGLHEKIMQTVTKLCGALSMFTGGRKPKPCFHGPLAKRFIFYDPLPAGRKCRSVKNAERKTK